MRPIKKPSFEVFSVLLHAWRRRSELDGTEIGRTEQEFLPAALSLQVTPPSRSIRVTTALLVSLIACAVAWACLAHIDVVVVAHGRVVMDGRSKVVQAAETGVIKSIHVRDGQRVSAGELLIELADTEAAANLQGVRTELEAARLTAVRGESMLAALDRKAEPAWPKALNDEDSARQQRARLLLASQLSEHQARINRMRAEVAQRRAEARAAEEQIKKIESLLPISRQRAEDFKQLVKQEFVSQHGFLERDQQRLELEGELSTLRERKIQLSSAVSEAEAQVVEADSQLRRVAHETILDGQTRSSQIEQELAKAEKRFTLTRLTAPVSGTIQQLSVYTAGGVVTAAQELVRVVPDGGVLEVEAMIENKDAAFVNAGMPAEIKFDAFQFTKYGTIHGTLASINRDAILDEKIGLVYATRVQMQSPFIAVEGKMVPIAPGMTASVEFRLRSRRVIEYFLSPLITNAKEALRER